MRLFQPLWLWVCLMPVIGHLATSEPLTGSPMQGLGPAESRSLDAARIALLAVRASLPQSVHRAELGVVVTPSTTPLSEEEAARVLAEMTKPVRCTGRDTVQLLTIECSTLVGPAVSELTRASVRESEKLVSAIRSRYCHGTSLSLIEVRGARRSLVVPLHTLIEYSRDYLVLGESFVEPPDEAALQLGACAVIVMRATGLLQAK